MDGIAGLIGLAIFFGLVFGIGEWLFRRLADRLDSRLQGGWRWLTLPIAAFLCFAGFVALRPLDSRSTSHPIVVPDLGDRDRIADRGDVRVSLRGPRTWQVVGLGTAEPLAQASLKHGRRAPCSRFFVQALDKVPLAETASDFVSPAEPHVRRQGVSRRRSVRPRMSDTSTVLPEKATHHQTRTFNQQLVLRALHDDSPLSRADLARLTGLTRTSVSDLVGSLIDDGLIEEVGRGRSSGGKSPILLRVAPEGRLLIGLDLADSQFSGAVVNLRGDILRSKQLPLEGLDGEAAVELVFRLVDALRADDPSPLLGIGIGAPGVIDTRSGTVRWSVNLEWADLPLGPLVESRYGVPVVVANDSHAAALAELTFYRRPRPNNLIVIKVGRGVGAGIIVNGQLFQGDGYGAGEFGHVSPGHEGAPCRCGRQGCLETRTSMRALVDAARTVEPTITDETGLVAAFLAGVAGIRQIVLDAARELGSAVGWLIGVLNVRHVLLVGPVAAFGEDWLDEVRRSALSSVLGLLARDTQIEFGHVHDDVVVLGASALLMEQQLGLGLAR